MRVGLLDLRHDEAQLVTDLAHIARAVAWLAALGLAVLIAGRIIEQIRSELGG